MYEKLRLKTVQLQRLREHRKKDREIERVRKKSA